jgi:peptide/nickel transport system permease protein
MTKKKPRLAVWLIGMLLFTAVFRDVLSNGRPLYCRIGGVGYWPGLRTVFVSENKPYQAPALRHLQQQLNQFEVWKNPANFDAPPVYAPIPFSPGENSTQKVQAFARPGQVHAGLQNRFVHWLGTDADGRDVAATLVSGARIALMTGTLAMLVTLLIGLTLGMIAGFFGDDRLRVSRGYLWAFLLSLPVAWFYAVTTRSFALQTAQNATPLLVSALIFVAIVLLFNRLSWLLGRFGVGVRKVVLPIDLIIMRISEVFSALPRLLLVIVMAVVLKGLTNESIWLMIGLLGALGWMGVAKLLRAELLRVRALEYVTAARGLGMSEWRVLLRHALPNVLRPIYVAFAVGASSAVLVEAYLSFLGFGGQSFSGISWGSLFFNENSNANPIETWWVTLFPGLLIFLTILALNQLGESLSERQQGATSTMPEPIKTQAKAQ